MAKQVGTWLYDTTASAGESVKRLRLDVRNADGVGWGTAVGMGWTPTLEVRKVGDGALFATITGTWEDATESAALFAIGLEASLVPAVGADPIDYDAILVMTFGSNVSLNAADEGAEPFRFRVQRWPA